MTEEALSSASDGKLSLTVLHHGNPQQFEFPFGSTISDLSSQITESLDIPDSHQKILVQRLGLFKPPFKDPNLPLSSFTDKKITLIAPTVAEICTISASITSARKPRTFVVPTARPARTQDWKRIREDSEYTFHTLRPLPYFPNPERSLKFLERLRNDPGIRAAMRTHKFSVPLLTEMDPAAHTSATHEGVSRTLGLNRNAGEVIELRLRTDAGDGYRDYKTIRKTLCHELAHNVHGPHDAKFWKLCKEIEKEVERADWTSGGHALSKDEFYTPSGAMEGEVHIDSGGWTGGEYVLGQGEGSGEGGDVAGNAGETLASPLTRREILARAAEERFKKTKKMQDQSEDNASGDTH